MRVRVFIRAGIVVAVSQVGSEDADVTFPGADTTDFIASPEVSVTVGYTYADGVYTAPAPI